MREARAEDIEIKAETVVADSKYGTIEDNIFCSEKKISMRICLI